MVRVRGNGHSDPAGESESGERVTTSGRIRQWEWEAEWHQLYCIIITGTDNWHRDTASEAFHFYSFIAPSLTDPAMSMIRKSSSNKEKLMSQHYELLFTKEQNELLSNQPDYWDTFFMLPVRLFTNS